VKQGEQYRQFAADCLRMAAAMRGDHKEALLKMADTWTALADQAERKNIEPKEALDVVEQEHAGKAPMKFRSRREGFRTWGVLILLAFIIVAVAVIFSGKPDNTAKDPQTTAATEKPPIDPKSVGGPADPRPRQ
jgi:ferric-dicitrate binding protein FerR (iron transport regulator)